MRILLVDDHALFLEGLNNLLNTRGIEVVGTAQDGLEALEKTRQFSPDMILMDIRMPRCDGLQATRLIKTEHPECQIVILTTSEEEGDLLEALRSGASGYLLKSLKADMLITYLEGIMQGEAVISGIHAAAMLQELARRPVRADEPAEAAHDDQHNVTLSARQHQILELAAQGLIYKEIAQRLNLSEHTIKYHMGEILRALHLKNREQVVTYALRTGLIQGTQNEDDAPNE